MSDWVSIDVDPNAPHDEDCGFWEGGACRCDPEMLAALERDHCHECDFLHGSGYNRCSCVGYCICDREAGCPCFASGVERRLRAAPEATA